MHAYNVGVRHGMQPAASTNMEQTPYGLALHALFVNERAGVAEPGRCRRSNAFEKSFLKVSWNRDADLRTP